MVGSCRISGNDFGPWSAKASFIAPETAFLGVSTFADPLTNGKTVGQQHGGTFIPGQGWQSLSQNDGIDYDLQTNCHDCRLEFDATNFGPQEGESTEKDLKWVSMGDASSFGSFGAFRDSPWKMHLVQRADFPRGMEIVWRNGGTDASGGDPGDHRIKLIDTPITFSSSNVYHFQLDWGPFGYTIAVNGTEVMADGWDYWYEPTNHRVSLGCYPRGDIVRRHHLSQREAHETLTSVDRKKKGARRNPGAPFLCANRAYRLIVT